ncbi:hypothetical protein GW17_00036533 [Ensete ventricosum]|nr:hypothetical protein GW17_00036533 [Ensete ventricosum]
MEKELESVSETTSELECFNVFSGSVGLSRHGTPLCSLVDAALELMATSSNSSGKKIVGYAWLSLATASFAPAYPFVRCLHYVVPVLCLLPWDLYLHRSDLPDFSNLLSEVASIKGSLISSVASNASGEVQLSLLYMLL